MESPAHTRCVPSDSADPRPLILVADDDRLSRELLASLLRNAGHLVDTVTDGQDVLDRVRTGAVSLVLMDVVMPRLGGLETCRLLKAMGADTFVPVMLCTSRADVTARVEGLRMGADDYVCKPYDERELLARVGAMLRIKAQSDTVRNARSQFETMASHDSLTGLCNYRTLNTRLIDEWKRAERYHEPLSVVLVDIDGFRAFNAQRGVAAGDAVLQAVARRLLAGVREVDVVARYGGDEFVVLLPNTHVAGALVVTDRLWRSVGEHEHRVDGLEHAVKLGCCLGVSAYPSPEVRTHEALLKTAEEALRAAQKQGPGRIVVSASQGYSFSPTHEPLAEKPGPVGEETDGR